MCTMPCCALLAVIRAEGSTRSSAGARQQASCRSCVLLGVNMKAGCPQQGPRRTLVVFSGVHASPKVTERDAIPPKCGHFDCMCLQSLCTPDRSTSSQPLTKCPHYSCAVYTKGRSLASHPQCRSWVSLLLLSSIFSGDLQC